MTKDSAVSRGLKTLWQTVVGLVVAVWLVPGVPTVVGGKLTALAAGGGVLAGLVATLYNIVFRADVPNL